MRTTLSGLAVAGVLAIGAGDLSAQRPQTREGFWISFGLGYGSAAIACDGCPELETLSSFTSYVRLGGTLNDRVLLGGDLVAWTKTRNGVTATLGGMMATLLFYPAPASGFFVRGGAGFALYDESNGGSIGGVGGGVLAGVGYDIRLGRNISLTAFADALYGAVGDLTTNGGSVTETGFTQTLLHAGLGVTFH
jgi:hypothetical protein